MFKLSPRITGLVAVASSALMSAAVQAQAVLPTGMQDAIDDNIAVVELVAAALLAIPLAFLAIRLILKAIKSH